MPSDLIHRASPPGPVFPDTTPFPALGSGVGGGARLNNKWMRVPMSCVCVCAYAAQADPVGAVSKACDGGRVVEGHRERPVGLGGGCREGGLDSRFSKFHLGPLPPLHFCLLEAAGLWGHCVERLKGFGGPGEQRGQRPGSAQSAQRGRGRRSAQDRLCHSGRDRAWDPQPLLPQDLGIQFSSSFLSPGAW